MPVAITLILFIFGFFVLIKGAQYLIRGATSLARLFGLAPWFIGVVIVGIGTSIPEFSINIASVFSGNNVGLAAIIGSNTFNILVILGLAALIAPITFRQDWIRYDLPLNMMAVLLVSVFILLPVMGSTEVVGISRAEGVVLVILLMVWIFFMLKRKPLHEHNADVEVFSWFTSFVFVIAGLVGVFLGGQWIVAGAESIATLIGISPALVGFTVVAIGTSVPELAVTIVAATKRQTSIAVGNIIGSNIFDFLGILGITALMKPAPVREALQFDIFATFGATIVLFLSVLFIGSRYTIGRKEGAMFIGLYLAYFAFLFIRG